MLIRSVIEEYEIDCRARKMSPRAVRGYVHMIGYFLDFLEKQYGVTELEDVKSLHIKKFLLEKERQGRKPSYVNDLLKVYRTFFTYCLSEEYLQRSPAANVHYVRQPKVLIRSFNEAEIKKMLNSIDGKDYISVRNKTIRSKG